MGYEHEKDSLFLTFHKNLQKDPLTYHNPFSTNAKIYGRVKKYLEDYNNEEKIEMGDFTQEYVAICQITNSLKFYSIEKQKLEEIKNSLEYSIFKEITDLLIDGKINDLLQR